MKYKYKTRILDERGCRITRKYSKVRKRRNVEAPLSVTDMALLAAQSLVGV